MISKLKNDKVRKHVLKNIGNEEELYKSIKEIIENIKRDNVKLKPAKRKELSKYKKLIKKFDKQNNKAEQKNLIHQSGGLLSTLIPLIISIVDSIS
ncbi:MAG: hypothetical protein QM535_17580 [Limnohabitans sp.]|nr:hypothetical protein [Limnohabitans sp.]